MTPLKRPLTVTEYVDLYDPNGMELGGSVFWRYVKIPSQAPTPENLAMEWLYSRSGNKLVSPYMERMAELKSADLESAWLSMGTMLSLKYLNKWQDITDTLYAEYSAIVDDEITKTVEQSVDTDRTTGGTDTDEITRTLDKSENLTEAVDRSLTIDHRDVEDTTDKLTVDRSKARTGNDTDTTSKEITETDTKTHLTDTDQTGTEASQQNLYSFNNVSGSAKGATTQNGMTTGGSTTTGTDTDERSYTENVTVTKGLDETETDTGTETTDRDSTVTSTGTDTEDVDRTQTVTGKDTESTGRTTSRTGSDKLSMDKSAKETTSGRHRPAQELIEAEIKLRMSHILTNIILADVDEMTTLSIY